MNEEEYLPAVPADEYSPFWPLAILILGLILWTGYQSYIAFAQKSALTAELKAGQPAIEAAQAAQSRLYALAQDLVETSGRDTYAAQIVKEANIQVKPSANGAGTATP